jgi:uncharacterized alkaline shock family protein YloU
MMATAEKKSELVAADKNGEKASAVPRPKILHGDRGHVAIHKGVVAKIAGLAVRSVDGVHDLVAYSAGQSLAHALPTFSRADSRNLGIHVEVGNVEAAIDVRIVTDYGASIPKVAAQIRARIIEDVQRYTGLKVVDVNIDIVDLYFPDDEKPEPEKAPDTSRVK